MQLYRIMSVLIGQPWLAFVAGLVLLVASRVAGSRTAMACAIPWLLYAAYEYAMKFRVLCSGECNIRIDLLVIYPALLVAALVGVAAIARAGFKRLK